MVNKIIADYLKTNKRLVVPQFGAFLHKDDGTVAFVPFLKKDDGVLIQLIGSAYGLNPGDAQAAIEEFTAEIKKEHRRARRLYYRRYRNPENRFEQHLLPGFHGTK